MKFVVSYSGGKDSVLALHHMIAQGHTPVALLVMVNHSQKRSWFHGMDLKLMEEVAASLEIPLLLCHSAGEDYQEKMEAGLRQAKAMGAEAAVYGDIDIEGHRQWCQERCDAVGLERIHPLWHRDREENTREAIDLGYQCLIKCVKNGVLPQDYLGMMLSLELLEEMKSRGIDVCGENGEYHTVVVGGPIFHSPVPYRCGEILDLGHVSVVDLKAE